MNSNIKSILQKILGVLVPTPEVGGLEISNDILRLVFLSRDGLKVKKIAQLKLPAGVLDKGEIKNREQFISALTILKSQIDSGTKKMNPSVIVALPQDIFFTDILEMPNLQGLNLKEALVLNLQTISPFSVDASYIDWQDLGINNKSLNRTVFFSLAQKTKIDAYLQAMEEAGFITLAIEPPTISIIRLCQSARKKSLENELLVFINSEGLYLIFVKNSYPYHDYFHNWKDLVGPEFNQTLTQNKLQEIIKSEINKVKNFLLGKSEIISGITLISPTFEDEFKEFLSVEFSASVHAVNLSLLSWNQTNVNATVLGAGLRGSMSRSRDTFISLIPISTEKEYSITLFARFFYLWRTITITCFLIILLVYAVLSFMVAGFKNNITNKAVSLKLSEEQIIELRDLEKKTNEVASLISMLSNIKTITYDWQGMINDINNSKSSGLVITHLLLNAIDYLITIDGVSASKTAISDFETKLKNLNKFKNIGIAPSKIRQTAEGFTFSTTFNF